ncbi:cilia- and flagella-associated protein 46-like isoform X2 [Babylonia areolata]|uniref:cilia- and flagella-associated protein 46-like isoform X2 n=1 Tax=Babylonia areolata TaxID=304850 RepID=UPI003FD1D196
MDTSIRSLLSSAETYKGSEKNPYLQQAYMQLRNVAESRPAVDAPDPFGQDLYVLCAETAYQYGHNEIARDCLKMFFMKQQPANQFLIRAYLCQAQLLAPQNANNPEQLDKAVVYMLKAISMAKKTPRYHFLVYNASVLYWQFCRPFLKPNYRQYLARSLHQVVKALDDIEDTDYEWRAQLMIALIECHLDAGRRNDASHIAAAAATFIKQNVPQLYKQVFGLMVRNQLVESAKLHKDVKTSPELSVFYKICKLKNSVEQEEPREYHMDISSILNQIGVVRSGALTSTSTERLSRKDSKNVSGRRSPSAHSISPTGEELAGGGTSRKSASKTGRRTPTPTTSKKLTSDSADRPLLLQELAHLCLELGFPDLASDCVEHMKTCNVKDQGFYLQVEFLQCLLMVKNLGEKQESYQKPVVDLRVQAIKRCEEAIMNAVRFGDPNVIQAGCVTQWNLCLPLTQPNLRRLIRKPLTLIAEALEDIQSLLIQLRCQIHTELARCEEDLEQIQVAMEHLKKALNLDDGNVYQERLEVMLRRLELRSQLYRQPERPEDQAAMIIEQARKADSGTIRMKRSLLVKAGEALAPDAFLLVLDSESDTKADSKQEEDEASGKGPLTVIKQLGGKARAFNRCVRKAEGHLKRLGDENDRERARLWADLAKTARKQEVWDVCRVAARFCILYDDGRWKNVSSKLDTPKGERSRTDLKEESEEKKGSSRVGSRPLTPVEGVPLYDKDLIRMLAEVNFINGEALVHLLRNEGVQLNDKPIPPEDKSKRPKGYVAKKPEEDPDWIEYCDWIAELSEASTKAFLRGMELGMELGEAWLVCCATSYIWNYNNHILSSGRHREIVPALTALLGGLKKVGHAGETTLLVNVCKALAYGLLSPWIPKPQKEEKPEPTSAAVTASPRGKGGKGASAPSKAKAGGVAINPDAGPDIKKAVEVCEFAIATTAGDNPQDVVPVAVRQPLLQIWVMAKQMGQHQISKTLGTDDDSSTDGQKPMTRAIVATEMLSVNKNGIMEFKETPFIGDIANMVEKSDWSDRFIELQMWVRLTYLAFETGTMHNLVMRCSNQALKFATQGTQPRARRRDRHQHMVEQEMLSYASVLQGQSLILNMAGKNSMRREAMEAFFNSCRFARVAGNFELVMSAARHYWNAAIPLVSQPIERELLQAPLKIILDCIAATSDKKVKIEEPPPSEEPPAEEPAKGEEEQVNAESPDGKKVALPPKPKPPAGMIGKPNEDLTLRAAMYGVLFQSYADMGEWELALQAMDQAVSDMPRTKHRLLVFKHRVMVKAKLGRSVHMDIQKFKDESEDYVAHMWRRVALSSKELCEQLSSYQNAIEALNSPSNEFQKVEYLMEFGQWLFTNEFPLQDVLDQVEWAVDILLNMQDEESLLKKEGKGSTTSVDSKKGKGKKVEKKRSKGSARSKASSMGRSKSPGTESRAKKVSDTKSEISDQDSEINAADYVPVVKESVIGALPINPSQKVSDLTDVRQLDALVRSHVLLADLTGRDSACYADILLQAYGYLLRLWKVLMAEAGPAMKEMAKSQQAAQAETAHKGKASGKGKGTGKEKDTTPVKEKPKRKGPLDAVPDLLEDWAVYDAPDEAVEAFQSDFMKKTGLNEGTIPKPMLTLFYLDSLTSQLKQVGYSHLTLPVLALQDVLSRSLLKNHSLHILVHLRALEVCQELDLKLGTEFHEGIVGPVRIREEDQAMSRQEIAQWKEKQVQVAREEMRIKETLARMTAESASRGKSSSTQLANKATKGEEERTVGHIGITLGAVSLRVVWTDIAEVLIRLGYLQRAREFLNEAFIAAKAFADNGLHARIMLLLARLSYEEAQYGQAINFCQKAQEIHEGDEMFWYETTLLLVNAALCDNSNRRSKRSAKRVLVHALNEFQQICNDRPNRAATIGFIMTMLESRLAEIQMDSVLEHHSDINLPKVMRAVLTVCEKVDSAAETLVRLGHRREAVPLVLKHAKHLTELARAATETNIQHAYYLEALGVLGEAESLAEQTFFDVQTLTILHETRNVSLAVQRELCEVLLRRGELLAEVGRHQVQELRALQLTEQRKSSVQRLVEDYTWQTPSYTPTDKAWLHNRACWFEEAGAALLGAHSLAAGRSDLRARALGSLGKCLRILAEHKGPDPPSQWLVHEMEMLRMQAEAEEAEAEEAEKAKEKEKEKEAGGEEGEEGAEAAEMTEEEERKEKMVSEEEERQLRKQAALISTMVQQHEQSKLYFTYATECLTQTLNLALANKHVAVVSEVALELVKCCGQFDPAAASQFLALFQSCQTSLRLEEILYQAQRDPMTSRLAALLHQRRGMLRDHLSTNLGTGTVCTSVTHSLEKDWQAWRLLEVLPNHMDLLKEFPPNFNFVILQHSPKKDFLFGAVLDKPKAVGGEKGKGNTKLAAASSNRAKIFGSETSPQLLQEMKSKWSQHKQSVQAFLLKQEYQRTQAAQRQKMLENLDDTKKLPKMLMEASGDEEQMLEEEFRELVAAMETYLKPVMAAVDTALRATYSPVGSTGNITKDSHKDKDKDKDKDAGNECVILLADADLLELPLEALSCLQADGITSLSRDFSLQFLYHRIHQGMNSDSQELESDIPSEAGKGKSGKKKDKRKEESVDKKKAKEAASVMSRIPGARDIKAKQAKIIPLSRPLQPWQQSIDTMNFRYIVDPNLDCPETEERCPIEQFQKVIDEYEQQFTPRWLGVTGTEHAPSVGEWEVYITESSSFVFYGLERFLSYLPPAKMSALNIPDCMLVYALDLAQTSKSFMRQSKLDVFKNIEDQSLERPLETAMLVSLTGIRCFITNQWYCSLAENASKLGLNMKDLLEKGKTTGQTVRLLFNPRKRRDEEKPKEAEEPSSHRDDHHHKEGSGAKGKKDESSTERSKKDEHHGKKDEHHHGKKGDDASKADTGSVFAESTQGDGATTDRDDPDKDQEEPKEEDLSVMRRAWFNMVCYGMPNLVVTQ